MDTAPHPTRPATEIEPTGAPPRPPCSRHDGWTAAIQEGFITVLADTGSVAMAARAVDRHPSSAYRLRIAPHAVAFRGAWNAAIEMAYTRLREVAFDRAVNGVEAPVFHAGEQIGSRIVHNDKLLMFLFEHTNRNLPYAPEDNLIGRHGGNRIADFFAKAVEALDPPPPPPPPAPKAAKRRISPSKPAAPRIPHASTPTVHSFNENDWQHYSGVDFASTSVSAYTDSTVTSPPDP